jgi:hypothetical protein
VDTPQEEVYEQFIVRLWEIFPEVGSLALKSFELVFGEDSSEGPRGPKAAAWLNASAQYFGMLEVLESVGFPSSFENPQMRGVLDVVRRLHVGESRPTWRLGLVQKFFNRLADGQQRIEVEPDLERAQAMSEYMSLVREYQTSASAREFMRWTWDLHIHHPELSSAEIRIRAREDFSILEGASLAVQLVRNCFQRLTAINDHAISSACWCFHGELFEQKHAFDIALMLRSSSQDVSGAELNQLAIFNDEYADAEYLAEIGRLDVAAEAAWSALRDEARWTAGHHMATWNEILGYVGSVSGSSTSMSGFEA